MREFSLEGEVPNTDESPRRCEMDKRAVGFVCEALLYISFALVVFFIIYGHVDVTTSFRMTKNVEDMFINSAFEGDIEFYKVTTVEDLWTYLTTNMAANLLSRADNSTASGAAFLIGTARLRQVRIRTDTCRFVREMTAHSRHAHCNGVFSFSQEDTGSYNGSWLKGTLEREGAELTEFSHQTAWELSTFPFVGRRATYPGGGYVLTLPRSHLDLLTVLQAARDSSDWVDERTRAVFLEFSLYNPSVNLFSVVIQVFELSPNGAITPFHAIFTSRLYHYSTNLEIFAAVCEGAFVLFVFIFVAKGTREALQKGLRLYLRNFWSCVDSGIAVLSIAAIGVFLERLVAVRDVMAKVRDSGGLAYVSFHPALMWDFSFQYIMALLSVLVMVTFFKLLRFNAHMAAFPGTLRLAAPTLLQLLVICFFMVTAFASFAAQSFATQVQGYKNFGASCLTLYNFILGVSDYYQVEGGNSVLGPLFFFVFSFIVQFFLLMVFISTILEAYHAFRRQEREEDTEADMAENLWKEAKFFLLRRYKPDTL